MPVELLSFGATTAPLLHTDPGGELPGGVSSRLELFDSINSRLDELLVEWGLAFVRGLQLSNAEDFRACVDYRGGARLTYESGNSPRTAVADRIYTSTEYPPTHAISLHNELSYAATWPTYLYFCCLVAPPVGGETPVCSGRAVLDQLAPAVRDRFEASGVRYRQHLHGGVGLGKSWQQTYETDDRSAVEELLRRGNVEFSWSDTGGLRTSQIRPAIREDPATGEWFWFNQAEQWHPTSLPSEDASVLLSLYSEEDLPLYASFGDGRAIGADDLEHVREVTQRNALAVPWQPGDLLIVDNLRHMHGRRSYQGDRRVLVAMT